MARANVSPSSSVSGALMNVGSRVLVHLLGLVLAMTLSNIDPVQPLMIYVGVICLIPRGDWKKPDWLIMVGIGAIQIVLASILTGGNFPLALLLGGFQSWLQRILLPQIRRLNDWLVLLFLLPAAGYVAPSLGLLNWICLAGLAVVGYVGQYVYKKIRADAILQDDLKTDLATLKTLCLDPLYSKVLMEPTKKSVSLIDSLAKDLQGRIRDGANAIHRIHVMVEDLKGFHLQSKPSSSSGWAYGLLQGGQLGGKKFGTEQQFLTRLQEFNLFLETERRKFHPLSDAEQALETKWLNYENSGQQLQAKAVNLPANMAVHAQNIASTVVEIVKNMRHDPADRAPGERFLDRYLPAAHKIVDEYLRLANATYSQEVEQALTRSVDVLGRLETAFKDELTSLLQNDAINFTAEVETLDVLLKMHGN
ncbi:MAG: 5-bromo-4-chloroindolyl phosphate hydrolysis family protein [Desulfovibrionaceae bacterium]|nr:5-bromo-4-chloroindolyl phosphate hydrolysis family protein [Desulfovibrionaceae bacterium]